MTPEEVFNATSASVEVSQYTVSLLPRGHRDFRHYRLTVDRSLTREGQISWMVRWGSWFLGHTGEWSVPLDSPGWRSAYSWLDREDALNEAREAVRHIEVNGIPVAAVLARGVS